MVAWLDKLTNLSSSIRAEVSVRNGLKERRRRSVSSGCRIWGEKLTEKAVWSIVKELAGKTGIAKLAPHDLRRTCARVGHAAGSELDQIQFLLGHVSVQTTERYLGCKQRIRDAVNDHIGIEPTS